MQATGSAFVFGQENLSNDYLVDDTGHVSMPLVGAIAARGCTIQELEATIAASLREVYLRDPHFRVQIDAYRPFFILGEVGSPGQYTYVSGITAKTAIAIAGGYTPRATREVVDISRQVNGSIVKARVSIDHPIKPGDTIHVVERWF